MQEINNDVINGKIPMKNHWSALELKKLRKDFTNVAK